MRATSIAALVIVLVFVARVAGAQAGGPKAAGAPGAKAEEQKAGKAQGAQAKGAAQVKYPEGYRNWAHVKSMVIEEGHPLYESFGGIHHVYANESARRALAAGKGRYPDGAVFVFDLLEAQSEDNAIAEGPRKVVGVMQKNAKAFASTGGWGFEGFKGDTRERVVTDMKSCFECHEPQKEQGYVFSEMRK